MNVNGINVEMPQLSVNKPEKKSEAAPGGFARNIVDAVNKVNKKQVEADSAVENMLTGKSRNIHETMIAMEKADISMKLMVKVRNEALDSYKRILTMK
ncbi:MAG: flagellar hook-basal body complex protein FliE [bacterium]